MEETPDIIPVELVPHRPEWAAMAQAEAARLSRALGAAVLHIHHIGSTAIPGILAKPIVDLTPIFMDMPVLEAAETALRALGYHWYGEFGIPGRRYCALTDTQTGKRSFQLHCFVHGNPEIARHVAFRDFLRAHPARAKEYEAEKIRAAALRPDDTVAYNALKAPWIRGIEPEALAWASPITPAPPAP